MDRYIVTWFISKSPQGDSMTDHAKMSPSHHRFWSNSQYRVALATEYPMWNYRFIESKVLDLYPLKLFRVVWKFSKFPTLRSIIFLQNINRYQLVYISDSSQLELCIYTNKIKNIKKIKMINFNFKPLLPPSGHAIFLFSIFTSKIHIIPNKNKKRKLMAISQILPILAKVFQCWLNFTKF